MSGAKRTSEAGPSGGGNAGAGGSSKRAKAVIQDLERLKCPNCLEFPRAEVYLCSKGHSVCSLCVEKLSNCPTCGAPYVTGRGSNSGRLRNHLAEGILENTLFDCSWREQGCKRKGFNRQQLFEHEGKCKHNPNRVKLCQMLFDIDCSFKVAPAFFKTPIQDMPADFRDHLLISHQTTLEECFIGVQDYATDKLSFETGDPLPFSGSSFLQLKNADRSPGILGYFQIFNHKDDSVADPRLSWFAVRITDTPQSVSVSVKFTLKSYTAPSPNNAGDDDEPNIEISWKGRIMGLTEFNEFETKDAGAQEKMKFSLPLSQVREYYLNPEGEVNIFYEFTSTPIN